MLNYKSTIFWLCSNNFELKYVVGLEQLFQVF